MHENIVINEVNKILSRKGQALQSSYSKEDRTALGGHWIEISELSIILKRHVDLLQLGRSLGMLGVSDEVEYMAWSGESK